MKTIIKIFICFSLIYTPFFVFAGAAEAWTIEEVVYNDIGKNLTYTASKTGAAANDYIYKAKVPVTAAATGSTVANMIRLGLAGAAIYGLVEGVGWIIENGVVKKRVEKEDDLINGPYVWKGGPFTSYDATSVCKLLFPDTTATGNGGVPLFISTEFVSLDSANCVYRQYGYQLNNQPVVRTNNPNYDPAYEPTYIPVSPSELGDLIIDSPVAPQVLPDIYNPNNPAGGDAPQKTADALDSANPQPRTKPTSDTKKKPNKDTNGDGEPDVYDPALPDLGEATTWPEACSWFPTICEWYKRYKEDSDLVKEHRVKQTEIWAKEELARQEEKQHRQDEKTFWQKVENWFDWSKDDTDLPDDEKPEIQDLPVPELKEDAIRWSAQCPADAQVPINMQGVSSTITFSWSPWCQLLDMIKPAIIASAYIGAAFIVLGLRT